MSTLQPVSVLLRTCARFVFYLRPLPAFLEGPVISQLVVALTQRTEDDEDFDLNVQEETRQNRSPDVADDTQSAAQSDENPLSAVARLITAIVDRVADLELEE